MAGLEITFAGPSIKFNCESVVAITGAISESKLNGEPVPSWATLRVDKGSILEVGSVTSGGCRGYVAVRYGLDVPLFMGSRATFALGKFGGHQGRPLIAGDIMSVGNQQDSMAQGQFLRFGPLSYPSFWQVGVMIGPHASPDFFLPESIQKFFETKWEVHYNSNKLGIRLTGPTLKWARNDGGDAGLHPSNIHDCVYAIGSINFSGDTPIILTCDGPSLGGFVCPATIVAAELWKIGQVKAGD